MISPKSVVCYLILIGLALTPVLGLQLWLRVLPLLGAYVTDGPHVIMIKVTKDAILCAILICFILDVLRGRPILCNPLLLCIVVLLGISFAVTAAEQPPVLALLGLRAFSPFFLVFIAYSYLDMTHIRSVVRVLSFLLIVELCAACIRMRYGLAIHGVTYLGLAARPSGTFMSPSSWSIFLCFIICYMLGLDVHRFGRPRRRTRCLVAVSTILVLLSGSGAGVLALTTLLSCYLLFFSRANSYLKASLVPMFLLMACVIGGHLHTITGRATIYRSLWTRVGIFSDVFMSAGTKEMLIGRGLGAGSNVAVTFASLNPLASWDSDTVFIADSLYASMMAQAGVLFLLVFLLLTVWVFRRALSAPYVGMNPVVLLAVPAALVGALGNVITEVFPVNWLLFIMYGVALKRSVRQVSEDAQPSPHNGLW